MTCPDCQADARCKGFRWRAALSLLGPIRLRRHYYRCRACRRGTCPRDALLGLRDHDLTPAADEVVCLAGVQASFAEAAEKVLPRLAGLRVAESTAERATEAAGARLAAALAAGATVRRSAGRGPGTRTPRARRCAYVSVDATGVGQQGPGGAAAEGRMATVGMVYNPVPEDRARWADPTRAAAGLAGAVRGPAAAAGGTGRAAAAPGRARWGWTRPSGGSRCPTAAAGWRTCCGTTSGAWTR